MGQSNIPSTRGSLRGYSGGELGDVHDRALMGAFGYLFLFVECFYFEVDAAVFYREYFRAERYAHPHRSGRQVGHVDLGTYGVVAGLEERLDGIAGRHLQMADQVRSRQHTGGFGAQEVDRYFARDKQLFFTLGSNHGYL